MDGEVSRGDGCKEVIQMKTRPFNRNEIKKLVTDFDFVTIGDTVLVSLKEPIYIFDKKTGVGIPNDCLIGTIMSLEPVYELMTVDKSAVSLNRTNILSVHRIAIGEPKLKVELFYNIQFQIQKLIVLDAVVTGKGVELTQKELDKDSKKKTKHTLSMVE